MTTTAGCASFGRRSVLAEKAAASRELARQGVAAMEAGQWPQAESHLQKAVEASPENAETRRYFAETLWHRGAALAALAQIREAARIAPDDAALAVRAGEMSLAVGAADEALAQANRAIQLDPKLATAWALRGRVFWQQQLPDRAMTDLQHALELAPDSPDTLLDVAVMYRERGQPARSLTTLHHLLDTYPPGEVPQNALLLEGLTLLDLGRPQQATASLLAASQRGPAGADVYYHLARAQSAAGHFGLAAESVQKALAVDATHQPSRELITQLAARAGPAESQRR